MNATTTVSAGIARTDLLPAAVPSFAIVLMTVVAILVWVGVRFLTKRHQDDFPWYGLILPRVITATAASWCGIQLLARWSELSGPWPVWFAAALAGLAIEAVAARYQYERRVVPVRLGQMLTLFRCLAVLLVIAVLLQPVRVWSTDRNITRRVAVLLDDSESMHFTDELWTTSERVELGLQADLIDLNAWPLPELNAISDWSFDVRSWTRTLVASNEAPTTMVKALEDGVNGNRQLLSKVDAYVESKDGAKAGEPLKRMQSLLRETLVPAFEAAHKAADAGELATHHLSKIGAAVEQAVATARPLREAVDAIAWDALPLDRREAVTRYCKTTRYALGASVLSRPAKGGRSLIEKLGERYDLYLGRLGDGLELLQAETLEQDAAVTSADETPERKDGKADEAIALTTGDRSLRTLTDYPTALEKILKDIPSEELAGVLIISDGRNNGAAGVEPIGRRLGLQGVPVSGVVIGGSRTPRDVAIAEVVAPESIFLGDRVRLRATVHVTGAKGSKINLMMSGAGGIGEDGVVEGDGDVVLDKALIDVLSDDFTHEVRLTHEPKQHGLRTYTLRTENLEGELFASNNTWKVDVAISDDRTNVLIVDDRPRWEFRYLRNLFFARDKSVHLQYYLVRPDEVAGVLREEPHPPASASRKFGDAEAGGLPTSRDEWRKFGMIVIGDVDAETLTTEVLADIRHCVSERGALLVVVAGRRHMPHTYDDEYLTELLPIHYGQRSSSAAAVTRLRSRLVLTGAGGGHPVMQQSASYSENAAIWSEMQPISWRFPVDDVKPGAEILAYAAPTEDAVVEENVVDVASAVLQINAESGRRARNALIVAQDYGRGKVLMLNFDQTWRLRHKAGDIRHHKLWGQIMRWGVGEKLRAGTETFRLGTDKLIYTPREAARVIARVTQSNLVGVADARLDVVVTRDEEELAHVKPVYREGSHGMYEVALPIFTELGRYELEMTRKDGGEDLTVRTAFMVVNARRSAELANVTSTRKDLNLLARLTEGKVVAPDRARDLWDAFGEGGTVVKERHERTLWDRPWVLILLIGLLTAEWVLRKRGGLT
jgi:hypothetical protein